MRLAELKRAAEILEVDFLEALAFPNALPPKREGEPRGKASGRGLADHPEAALAIRERLLSLRPRYVLTFPPDGINGHPDHVAASRYAWEAAEGLAQVVYFVRPQGPFPVTHRLRLPSGPWRGSFRLWPSTRPRPFPFWPLWSSTGAPLDGNLPPGGRHGGEGGGVVVRPLAHTADVGFALEAES